MWKEQMHATVRPSTSTLTPDVRGQFWMSSIFFRHVEARGGYSPWPSRIPAASCCRRRCHWASVFPPLGITYAWKNTDKTL